MGERYADVVDRMDSGTARYVRFGQRFSADRGTHMVLDLCVIGALVVGQGGVHTDSSTHAALLLLAGSVRCPRGQFIIIPSVDVVVRPVGEHGYATTLAVGIMVPTRIGA